MKEVFILWFALMLSFITVLSIINDYRNAEEFKRGLTMGALSVIFWCIFYYLTHQ